MSDFWEEKREQQYAMEEELNKSMAVNISYDEEEYEDLKKLLASTRRDMAKVPSAKHFDEHYRHLEEIESSTVFKMRDLEERIQRKKEVLMQRRMSSVERRLKKIEGNWQ